MTMPVPRHRWTGDALAILLLVLLTLIPRLVFLGADPPGDFQTGYLPDEGGWAHNARQHVLFGRWIMDEHNPAIFAAPLYSLALDALYRVIGIGLVETRLLSALSGFLACVLWFGGLRAVLPVRRALPPALVLGLSYFMLTNNRVGFTESFQLLFVAGAAAALLHSLRRPRWALVSGACFALSLLVKPSAAVMGPVFVLFWVLQYRIERNLRAPKLFVAGALSLALLVILLVVLPNWGAVTHQLGISLRNVYTTGFHPGQVRVALFGWPALGLTMNGFFLQCWLLVGVVTLYGIARLGRAVEHPVGPEEQLCWIWLAGGLLFLANQQYQPDRRFLLLLPPLTCLAWSAVVHSGLRIPARPALTGPRGWLRAVAIGGLVGGVLGFYFQYLVRSALVRNFPSVFPSRETTGAIIWSLAILLGGAVAVGFRRKLPLGPARIPAAIAVAIFLLGDPLRFGLYLSQPQYLVLTAGRDLAMLTKDLPSKNKVIVGTQADALALSSDLFAFTIRIRDWNRSYLNLDGWDRFQPSLAVVTSPPGRDPVDVEQNKVLGEALNRGFIPVARWPTNLDSQGRPVWMATLYAEPGLLGTALVRTAASLPSNHLAAIAASLDWNPEPPIGATFPGFAMRHPVIQVPAIR